MENNKINPALKELDILVGNWETTGTHGFFPVVDLRGQASFEWIEGGVEVAMMVTPDGHNRLELSRFIMPAVVADHRTAPVNAFGYLRAMFTVSGIDETLGRLKKLGAELVGEVVQYENLYRLCYVRGPEGILIGLAEELGKKNEIHP